jgi:hypothetical protein
MHDLKDHNLSLLDLKALKLNAADCKLRKLKGKRDAKEKKFLPTIIKLETLQLKILDLKTL